MSGSWARVAIASMTLVAGAAVVGCSGGSPETVGAQVADARVARVVPPQAPRRLQIVMVDGTCVASWQPPPDDGGAPVTGYVVTSESRAETSIGSGPDIGSAATARRTPGSVVSIMPTALPQTIRVQAHTIAGDGPAGDPATC